VVESVRALRAAGAKLVVCTNKPTDMSRRLLAELGIADHFHGIVGLDAVSAAKPVPAHLIEAIAAVGGDLSRAVTVGDSEIDADTMRAAGTALILVAFGYTEVPAHQLAPDALLRHFEKLAPACIANTMNSVE
jgi:phosphoglycolate phosphatase